MRVKKRLLVLGGGPVQMQLIKAAKKEEYCVIVFDYNDDCIGRTLCDEFYHVSIIDKDAVLKKASEICVDGIVANSEAAMGVVAFVSQKLGLMGDSEEAISYLTTKHKFRELQRKVGVFAPVSNVYHSYEQFICDVDKYKFPIVVKPNASSGSRGTTRIDSKEELDKVRLLFEECSDFSRDNFVTVEEYVQMPSLNIIGGDVFVYKDTFFWSGLMIERRDSNSPMVPMCERHPTNLTRAELQKVKEDTVTLFKGAGIKFGEYNVESYFTAEGELFYIEINARQGGDGVQEHIRLHSTLDMNRLYVTTAVGDESYYDLVKDESELESNYTIDIVVYPSKTGVLKGVYVDSYVERYVHHIERHVEDGVIVRKMENASDCVAVAFLILPNKEKQMELFECLDKYIYAVVDEN